MTYDKAAWRGSVVNGRIPADKLAAIVPTQYDPDLDGPALMHPEAAAAMSALLAAARASGVTELKVKYSYRTFAKQQEKYDNYLNGGNLAAVPGTSNHGWAVAVDFTGLTTRALAWLRANAGEYGFLNDVPSENWHYTYQGGFNMCAKCDELVAGLSAFIQGAAAPADGAGAKVFRALTKAAALPKPTGCGKDCACHKHTHTTGPGVSTP